MSQSPPSVGKSIYEKDKSRASILILTRLFFSTDNVAQSM